jgi:hypothetical protein
MATIEWSSVWDHCYAMKKCVEDEELAFGRSWCIAQIPSQLNATSGFPATP